MHVMAKNKRFSLYIHPRGAGAARPIRPAPVNAFHPHCSLRGRQTGGPLGHCQAKGSGRVPGTLIIEGKALTSQYRSLSTTPCAAEKGGRPHRRRLLGAGQYPGSRSKTQHPLRSPDTQGHVDANEPVPGPSYASTARISCVSAKGSHVAVESAGLRPVAQAQFDRPSGPRRWVVSADGWNAVFRNYRKGRKDAPASSDQSPLFFRVMPQPH